VMPSPRDSLVTGGAADIKPAERIAVPRRSHATMSGQPHDGSRSSVHPPRPNPIRLPQIFDRLASNAVIDRHPGTAAEEPTWHTPS
jgi:hypothetical protein